MKGLKSAAYTSWNIFRTEQQKIFRNSWLPVTVTQELAGKRTPFELSGRSLFLQDGKAFSNSCTHRLTKLVECQEKSTKVVRCKYHNWCFKDGILVRSPGLEQQRCEGMNLKSFGARVIGNIQYLHLGQEKDEPCIPDFSHHTQEGGFAGFNLAWTKEYRVRANWKHIIENFLDYLHVPAIHPTLAPSSKMDDHHPSPCTGRHIAFHTDPIGDSDRNPLSLLHVPRGNLTPTSLYFHVLFPNCFLFCHTTHMFAVFVDPISPNESVERAYLLVHPETEGKASPDLLQDLADFYDDVNSEDVAIVEQCQQGCYADEERSNLLLLPIDRYVAAFQEMYDQAMMMRFSKSRSLLSE